MYTLCYTLCTPCAIPLCTPYVHPMCTTVHPMCTTVHPMYTSLCTPPYVHPPGIPCYIHPPGIPCYIHNPGYTSQYTPLLHQRVYTSGSRTGRREEVLGSEREYTLGGRVLCAEFSLMCERLKTVLRRVTPLFPGINVKDWIAQGCPKAQGLGGREVSAQRSLLSPTPGITLPPRE